MMAGTKAVSTLDAEPELGYYIAESGDEEGVVARVAFAFAFAFGDN